MSKRKKPVFTPPPFCGVLRMNPRGFGFVVSDNPKYFPEDAFIGGSNLGGAVDGDTVEVDIFPIKKEDKGPEGKIIRILQRGRSKIAALVYHIRPSGVVLFYSPLLGHQRLIESASSVQENLSVGDRVMLEIVEWGKEEEDPILAEIQKVLGPISDASIDNTSAAEEFQIPTKFPPSVIRQAKSFGNKVKPKDLQGREDLTKLECFTIDPTTAKDFDDALSLSKDIKGHYHLGVHIADVAHYVRSSTPLDAEASVRSNSTYLPGHCIPMLPEELSNNLCSLKPKVLRLCVSVFMTFDLDGTLLSSRISRSYIKSAKRFTYEEAKLVLDAKKKSQHAPTLHHMVDLCYLLRKKRNERGSIDFSLPEVVLVMDKKGNPSSYEVIEYDITHQMVEEFMLKANEVVATTLQERGSPPIFRVHEEPAPENKEEFWSLARMYGFFLPPAPSAADIQKLFQAAKHTPYASQLSVAFIRSMKLAQYSSNNIGHYGLALEYYCHFTSPIRRYCDLIVQRLLFGENPEEDLEVIAKRCSDRERVSFKAEQSVKTLKKLRLLHAWLQEDPSREYACQITKIRPFGLHFELSPLGVDGSLHVSEIRGDYFIYESEKNSFLGRHSHIRFCVGDTILMRLESVDLVGLVARWSRVFTEKETAYQPSRKQQKKRRRRR